eukprot:5934438-Pyramimonas_sp.AAC.2
MHIFEVSSPLLILKSNSIEQLNKQKNRLKRDCSFDRHPTTTRSESPGPRSPAPHDPPPDNPIGVYLPTPTPGGGM